MPPLPVPEHDDQRVAKLASYGIVDSLPEQEYDDLARLAAAIVDVPIALVSFVDGSRQWFKARVGIDLEESRRDISFCLHVVASREAMVVNDATTDPRFADNPFVNGELSTVRFYAGAPLMTPDGFALGTICVLDFEKRELGDGQLESLESLSRLVVSQLELRNSNIELEEAKQAAEVAAQDAANAELRATTANRAKSRFLTTMSHELRTPLTAIIGFGGLLADNMTGGLDADEVDYALRIKNAGVHLLSVINDVLDLAKIDDGHLPIRVGPTDLNKLVDETLQLLENQARTRRVRLRAVMALSLEPIEADAQRLKQVLINLIGNALRFSGDGVVEVRLVPNPESPTEALRLDVVDSGRGIAAQKLESMFDRFVQGDESSTREHGGTGLGLPIARSLCGAMGFRLVAASRVGVGSTFSVLLRPHAIAPVHQAPHLEQRLQVSH